MTILSLATLITSSNHVAIYSMGIDLLRPLYFNLADIRTPWTRWRVLCDNFLVREVFFVV